MLYEKQKLTFIAVYDRNLIEINSNNETLLEKKVLRRSFWAMGNKSNDDLYCF